MKQKCFNALLFFALIFFITYISTGVTPLRSQVPELKEAKPGSGAPIRGEARESKIALFYSRGFPNVDAPSIKLNTLTKAIKDSSSTCTILTSTEDLKDQLNTRNFNLLILPYGSAFPMEAWISIKTYLENGGNLLVLGGAPFHQPMLRDRNTGKWIPGIRQPSFAHLFLIGPAEALSFKAPKDPSKKFNLTSYSGFQVKEADLPAFHKSNGTFFSLTPRFAEEKEFPEEDGSYGKYLARMRPLIHITDKEQDNLPTYCPVVEIDRLKGKNAGARWVFVTSDHSLTPGFIRACIQRALMGAVSLEIYPLYASIQDTENPRFRIRISRPCPTPRDKKPSPKPLRVIIKIKTKETGKKSSIITTKEISIPVSYTPENGQAWQQEIQVPMPPNGKWKPGLYQVELSIPHVHWAPSQKTTGFLVKDDTLLSSGPQLTVSRDWFRLNGKVFPIIGTTYMDSDSHRKFLMDPNPWLWDLDLSIMKTQGINFIRTGIWTGWKKLLQDEDEKKSSIRKSVLHSLDAFVQTAARHQIMVCFTFFAFLPPDFGGTHPYLDPKSTDKQISFIQQIVSRYKGVNWIHFDLINEPSYASPKDLWLTRPIGDSYEKKAWKNWLLQQHPNSPLLIQNRHQDPANPPFSLPLGRDFNYSRIKDNYHPSKACDFILFTQDVFCQWTQLLYSSIKNTNPNTLVTIGQDEGGLVYRPSQQFFAQYVDYTSVHSWWFNDDLLWDGLASRSPGKPNLISETGMMRLEDMNGMPWRTPLQAALLLDRKFAYAFASKGAGFVQWIWNINPYQPLDNEAVIGCFRVDGTAKPELRVTKKFSQFFRQAAPFLEDFEPCPSSVTVILPHSRLYSSRPMGTEASRQLIRILANHFQIFPTCLSEYTVTSKDLKKSKLIILPVPEMLSDRTCSLLSKASKQGIKILVTGPLTSNSYGEISPSLMELGLNTDSKKLSLFEPFSIPTSSSSPSSPSPSSFSILWASFPNSITQFIKKGAQSQLHFESSNIWHEALPLELSPNPGPLITLLKAALSHAGIPYSYSHSPLCCRLLYTPKSILGICINETSEKQKHTITLPIKNRKITFSTAPNQSRLLLIDRSTGKLILISPGDQPIIH